MAEFKFEVWDVDHGHNENHSNFCGEATTAEEAGALVTKAINDYPIFTSDEIVVHTVYSDADGGGKNGESHMFDDVHEGMPEGDPIVSENMPEDDVHQGDWYTVTIKKSYLKGAVRSTETMTLDSEFFRHMFVRNLMNGILSDKDFTSIVIEKHKGV